MTKTPDPAGTTMPATDEESDSGFGEGGFCSNADSFTSQPPLKAKLPQPIYN